jgi:hypothetical protein
LIGIGGQTLQRAEVEISGDVAGLERALNSARQTTRRAFTDMDQAHGRYNRSMLQVTRGTLAGSGAFQSLGRQIAFASGAFLGTAGLVAGIRGSVEAASNLNESINVTGLVFKEGREQIEAFVKESVNIGMSERAARDATSTFGGLLQNLGLANTEMLKWSQTLTVLSADLASAFNTEPAQAVDALTSALRGQTRPMTQYNVVLGDTEVRQKAVEMGLANTTAEVDRAAKAQATLQLVMEQTSAVHGDFENTSDNLANAKRRLSAQVENLKARLGEALIPMVEGVINKMIEWAEELEKNEELHDKLITTLERFSAFLKDDVVPAMQTTFNWSNKVAQQFGGWLNLLKWIIGMKLVTALVGWTTAITGLLGSAGLGAGFSGASGLAGAVSLSTRLKANLLWFITKAPITIPLVFTASIVMDKWILPFGDTPGSQAVGGEGLLQRLWGAVTDPKKTPLTPGEMKVKYGDNYIQPPSDHKATHQTAGLPGYPAVDYFGKPGTKVLAPEDGAVRRHSGRGGTSGGFYGWSLYYAGHQTGNDYYFQHLLGRAKIGTYKRGDVIGTISPWDDGAPHVHIGIKKNVHNRTSITHTVQDAQKEKVQIAQASTARDRARRADEAAAKAAARAANAPISDPGKVPGLPTSIEMLLARARLTPKNLKDDLAAANAAIKHWQGMLTKVKKGSAAHVKVLNEIADWISKRDGILADIQGKPKPKTTKKDKITRAQDRGDLPAAIDLALARADATQWNLDDDIAAIQSAIKWLDGQIKKAKDANKKADFIRQRTRFLNELNSKRDLQLQRLTTKELRSADTFVESVVSLIATRPGGYLTSAIAITDQNLGQMLDRLEPTIRNIRSHRNKLMTKLKAAIAQRRGLRVARDRERAKRRPNTNRIKELQDRINRINELIDDLRTDIGLSDEQIAALEESARQKGIDPQEAENLTAEGMQSQFAEAEASAALAIARAALTPGDEDDLAALRSREAALDLRYSTATTDQERLAAFNDLQNIRQQIQGIYDARERLSQDAQRALTQLPYDLRLAAARGEDTTEAALAYFRSVLGLIQDEDALLTVWQQITSLSNELNQRSQAQIQAFEQSLTTLPADLRLRMAQARGTEDPTDDLALARQAELIYLTNLSLAQDIETQITLTDMLNSIRAQIKELEKQTEALDEGNRLQDQIRMLWERRFDIISRFAPNILSPYQWGSMPLRQIQGPTINQYFQSQPDNPFVFLQQAQFAAQAVFE